MKFKYECPICKKEVELDSSDHYIATTNNIFGGLVVPAKTFDAYDCPCCKSQIIMGERLQLSIHFGPYPPIYDKEGD